MRDGVGVVCIHDKNCILKLQTALSTASRSPSPVSERLLESHLLLNPLAAKQEFIESK